MSADGEIAPVWVQNESIEHFVDGYIYTITPNLSPFPRYFPLYCWAKYCNISSRQGAKGREEGAGLV